MKMAPYQIDGLIAAATSIVILMLTGAGLLAVLWRRMKERHELRRALLEKLPAEELIRLAESEGGRAWLRDVLAGARDRHASIERALQVIFAGVACGFAAGYLHQKPIGVAGMILAAAGLGQLVATFLFDRRDKASDEK